MSGTREGTTRFVRRTSPRTPGWTAKIAVAACASCLLAVCVGIGFASAGNDAASRAASFGIDASVAPSASASAASDDGTGRAAGAASDEGASGTAVLEARDEAAVTRLTNVSTRDISKGIAAIEAEEEAARLAEEERVRAEDQAHADRAAANRAQQLARDASAATTGLPDVDWSVGHTAFVATWSERIDVYLAGSPLAGYGMRFAEAAWENGIDPRFSPAISNTESTKGLNCFRSHNAWGWMGDAVWSSWNEAIDAHAAGLASGYGYTISLANAKKYCPPTYEDWYAKTLAQMRLI